MWIFSTRINDKKCEGNACKIQKLFTQWKSTWLEHIQTKITRWIISLDPFYNQVADVICNNPLETKMCNFFWHFRTLCFLDCQFFFGPLIWQTPTMLNIPIDSKNDSRRTNNSRTTQPNESILTTQSLYWDFFILFRKISIPIACLHVWTIYVYLGFLF